MLKQGPRKRYVGKNNDPIGDGFFDPRDEKATERFLVLLSEHHQYGAGELRLLSRLEELGRR